MLYLSPSVVVLFLFFLANPLPRPPPVLVLHQGLTYLRNGSSTLSALFFSFNIPKFYPTFFLSNSLIFAGNLAVALDTTIGTDIFFWSSSSPKGQVPIIYEAASTCFPSFTAVSFVFVLVSLPLYAPFLFRSVQVSPLTFSPFLLPFRRGPRNSIESSILFLAHGPSLHEAGCAALPPLRIVLVNFLPTFPFLQSPFFGFWRAGPSNTSSFSMDPSWLVFVCFSVCLFFFFLNYGSNLLRSRRRALKEKFDPSHRLPENSFSVFFAAF